MTLARDPNVLAQSKAAEKPQECPPSVSLAPTRNFLPDQLLTARVGNGFGIIGRTGPEQWRQRSPPRGRLASRAPRSRRFAHHGRAASRENAPRDGSTSHWRRAVGALPG